MHVTFLQDFDYTPHLYGRTTAYRKDQRVTLDDAVGAALVASGHAVERDRPVVETRPAVDEGLELRVAEGIAPPPPSPHLPGFPGDNGAHDRSQ